jgi:hypothetical protein
MQMKTYLIVSGCLGIALWFYEVFRPFLRIKGQDGFFRRRFNLLLVLGLSLCVAIYFVFKLFSFWWILLVVAFVSLVLGSLYFVLQIVNVLTRRFGIRFDITLVIVAFILMVYFGYDGSQKKGYPLFWGQGKVDSKSFTFGPRERKLAFLGEYRAGDAFTISGNFRGNEYLALFVSKVPDELSEENTLAENIISYTEAEGRRHCFYKSGYLGVQVLFGSRDGEQNIDAKIYHKFNWRKLLIKDFALAWVKSVYFLLLAIVAVLKVRSPIAIENAIVLRNEPQNDFERNVMSFSTHLPDMKKFESYVQKHKDDQNVLIKLFQGWTERFGTKIDIKNMVSRIEDIEAQTRGLEAYKKYQETYLEVDDPDDFEMKRKIKKRKLEAELLDVEKQIGSLKGDDKEASIEKGEKSKSEVKRVVDILVEEVDIAIAQMENMFEITRYAHKKYDEIEKEYGKDAADQFWAALYEAGIINVEK